MPQELDIESFLERSRDIPVVDVRSPGEFIKGHIPGAINIPLFTDEERAIIGTLYVQKGKEIAVLKGLEIVGPKMKNFVIEAQKSAKRQQLLVHCWRGGMRSKNMAWLFEQLGIRTFTLKRGYKAFRQHVIEKINCSPDFTVVGGMTGSGKSEILREIEQLGHQILDLEALANHKGSAFGALGQPEQPSQEQFENNLFAELQLLNLDENIWVEDESFSIGKAQLPKKLFETIQQSKVLCVSADKKARIDRLVRDYGVFPKEMLAESIRKIEKRLGFDQAKLALAALEDQKLDLVADIVLRYYDKAYSWQLQNRNLQTVVYVETYSEEPFVIANRLIELTKIKTENIAKNE